MDKLSLYLDPQIRDWVLFPITLVMVRLDLLVALAQEVFICICAQILVGILRHYVVVLLQSPPKQLSRAATREQ